MSKKRLYEIAKELGKESKEVVARAKELGLDVKSHSSSVEEAVAAKIAASFKSAAAPKVEAKPVGPEREYRKVPMERLMARLDLTRYNREAPLDESAVPVKTVRILLSQHIGAPASAIVKAGDMVTKGQMIAEPGKGLSVGIHASVNGLVTEVNEKYIVIESQEGRAGNE